LGVLSKLLTSWQVSYKKQLLLGLAHFGLEIIFILQNKAIFLFRNAI